MNSYFTTRSSDSDPSVTDYYFDDLPSCSSQPPDAGEVSGSCSSSEVPVAIEIASRIEYLLLDIVVQIANNQPPRICIYSDSWDSLTRQEEGKVIGIGGKRIVRSSASERSLESWSCMMFLLQKIHSLLPSDSKATLRHIYYENVPLFRTQATVNRLTDDITRILNCSRRHLNIIATAKGLVMGDLRIQEYDKQEIIDCSERAVLIPNDMLAVRDLQTDADIILIVEKDAVFHNLVQNDIFRRFSENSINILLVTGKGVPDLCTRELLHRLHSSVIPHSPMYVLTDADPYGMEIASVYKFGSLSKAHDPLGLPFIKWIGVHPTEMESFNIKLDDCAIPLTKCDYAKLKSILKRPWIRDQLFWRKQLEFMMVHKFKIEIQAMSKFGEDFLVNKYLLTKVLMDESFVKGNLRTLRPEYAEEKENIANYRH